MVGNKKKFYFVLKCIIWQVFYYLLIKFGLGKQQNETAFSRHQLKATHTPIQNIGELKIKTETGTLRIYPQNLMTCALLFFKYITLIQTYIYIYLYMFLERMAGFGKVALSWTLFLLSLTSILTPKFQKVVLSSSCLHHSMIYVFHILKN